MLIGNSDFLGYRGKRMFAEHALDKEDIKVAQYLTAMPPKEELEEKLCLAIQRAKIQLE